MSRTSSPTSAPTIPAAAAQTENVFGQILIGVFLMLGLMVGFRIFMHMFVTCCLTSLPPEERTWANLLRTHPRSHARTHARTHPRIHACTCAPTHAHPRAHPRTHPRAHTRTHARTQTRTHARTHSVHRYDSCAHTHITHNHTRTRARTTTWLHTHSHTTALPQVLHVEMRFSKP